MANLNILNIGTGATLGGDGHAPLAAFKIPAALRTGLVRAVFMGNGLLDDFGGDGTAATLVGAPTRTATGYSCDQGDYIDMEVADTASITVCIIAKRTSSAATGYAGNFNYIDSGTDLSGVGFYSNASGTTMAFAAARAALAANPASITSTLDNFGLYVGRSSTAANTKINNLTAGTSFANVTGTGTARDVSTANLRAGAVVGSAYAAGSEIALMMVWNRYLTDGEVVTLDTFATAYAADLGITV